jgi:seryl-tRNA synthetase
MLWTWIAVRRDDIKFWARIITNLRRLGAKIAGHRGYFLTNDGVDLNQALISYGLDYLRGKGYKKIQPPFFMNKDQMAKTAQLDQFDEELYKVIS